MWSQLIYFFFGFFSCGATLQPQIFLVFGSVLSRFFYNYQETLPDVAVTVIRLILMAAMISKIKMT